MYLKYDNMHNKIMFFALIYINTYIITSINCMLSIHGLLRFVYDTFYIYQAITTIYLKSYNGTH